MGEIGAFMLMLDPVEWVHVESLAKAQLQQGFVKEAVDYVGKMK